MFLINKIKSFELVEKQISDAILGLELDRNIVKKVWMYFIEVDGTIIKTVFESTGAVAKFLNVQYRTITDHLDKWIKVILTEIIYLVVNYTV